MCTWRKFKIVFFPTGFSSPYLLVSFSLISHRSKCLNYSYSWTLKQRVCMCFRVEKIREMLAASNELERKLEFLKRWFGNVENQLSQPIHVHSLDDEAFDHILNKHQVRILNLFSCISSCLYGHSFTRQPFFCSRQVFSLHWIPQFSLNNFNFWVWVFGIDLLGNSFRYHDCLTLDGPRCFLKNLKFERRNFVCNFLNGYCELRNDL